MPVVAAAAGLVLLGSACGGSSGSGVARVGTTTSSKAPSANRSALAFARCMRRHGVNVPDNLADTPATPWGDAAGVHAALRACGPVPGNHSPLRPNAQELRQLLAYAVCMRAHHVEISDPDPATGEMSLPGYTRARMQTDPTYKAADAACKDKLPGRWQLQRTRKG